MNARHQKTQQGAANQTPAWIRLAPGRARVPFVSGSAPMRVHGAVFPLLVLVQLVAAPFIPGGAGSLFAWTATAVVSGVLVGAVFGIGMLWWTHAARSKARRELDEERKARLESEAALYAMAHDLRSPLVTLEHLIADVQVGGSSNGGPGTQVPELVHCRQVVGSMQGLVDQVLDFARGMGEADGNGEVWVPTALCETVDLVASRCEDLQVKMIVEGGPDAALDISPQALRHVVLNLLDNAVKYGPDHDAVVRVSWDRLEGEGDADGFVIEVADNGDGIPEADRERVFDLLTRLPDRQGRERPGAGVGLALVRRIVHKQGGRVEIQQAPEGGALMRVVYPASKISRWAEQPGPVGSPQHGPLRRDPGTGAPFQVGTGLAPRRQRA